MVMLGLATTALAQGTRSPEPMSLGDPAAPVTVVEYCSFTAPHCATFHTQVFPLLRADYIETGLVRLVFREVYFDRYGLWAAVLARCDGSKYAAILDQLFARQIEWTRSDDPYTVMNNLKKFGRESGQNDRQMDACLEESDVGTALAAQYQRAADADGVNAVPAFIINGEKYPNMAYDDFVTVLDAQLGR